MAPDARRPAILGIAGPSGSGKTRLIERLLPVLVAAWRTVSTVKHVHHELDLDKPGKDSYRHREAGATQVMVGLPSGWTLFHPGRGAARTTVDDLVAQMAAVDLVLVEGYRSLEMEKIEVFCSTLGEPLNQPRHRSVVAVAADTRLSDLPVPSFHRDDIDAIAAFVLGRLGPTAAGTG
ncbi:MAG: molybdopterin-guanine dinucleotide biosynthesis protein B [Proteobacteria bacterium]|nr:molybdopterin-guanine dinucleotide biosynthesis protein B [Pseudomonadota bacterium]